MNVSSISGISNSTYSPINDNNDVAQLEKQKQKLQQELQQLNQSKADDKTKQQKNQTIQQQIQLIDTQIQQKQAAKNKQSQNSGQVEQLNKADNLLNIEV